MAKQMSRGLSDTAYRDLMVDALVSSVFDNQITKEESYKFAASLDNNVEADVIAARHCMAQNSSLYVDFVGLERAVLAWMSGTKIECFQCHKQAPDVEVMLDGMCLDCHAAERRKV